MWGRAILLFYLRLGAADPGQKGDDRAVARDTWKIPYRDAKRANPAQEYWFSRGEKPDPSARYAS